MHSHSFVVHDGSDDNGGEDGNDRNDGNDGSDGSDKHISSPSTEHKSEDQELMGYTSDKQKVPGSDNEDEKSESSKDEEEQRFPIRSGYDSGEEDHATIKQPQTDNTLDSQSEEVEHPHGQSHYDTEEEDTTEASRNRRIERRRASN